MRRFHAMPPQESGNGVKSGGGVYIFFPQVVKYLHMQRAVAPSVGFVEVDGDLHSHGGSHFITTSPRPCLPTRPVATEHCCLRYWCRTAAIGPARNTPSFQRRNWRRL